MSDDSLVSPSTASVKRIFAGIAFTMVVIALGTFVLFGTPVTADLHPEPVLASSVVSAFDADVSAAITSNHATEMATLTAQSDSLKRIEESITALADAEAERTAKEAVAAAETEAVKAVETEGAKVAAAANLVPVRMSNTRWNINGDWNYSDQKLRDHVREHGVDPDGFSRDELETIHDNIHNGFPALGNGDAVTSTKAAVKSTSPVTTTRYRTSNSKSRRGFFGRFQSSSNCPNGRCPQ